MLMQSPTAPPRSMSNPSIMYGFSGEPSPGHPSSRAVSEKLASPSIAMESCGVSCSGVGIGIIGDDGSIKTYTRPVVVKMNARLTATIISLRTVFPNNFLSKVGVCGHAFELSIPSL